MPLPNVKKPFNSKVIKSFVPELRSRKVFRVSGFLCYLYMSYKHSMNISHIRIYAYYGYVTKPFNCVQTNEPNAAKNNVTYKLFAYKSFIQYTFKKDFALNNLQELICHKTLTNQNNHPSLSGNWFEFKNVILLDRLTSRVKELSLSYYLTTAGERIELYPSQGY